MTTRGVAAAVVVMIGMVAGCGPGKVPGRVVRLVQDTTDTKDIYTVPFGWSGSISDGAQVAWLRPGTMLGGDPGLLVYQPEDGDGVRLATSSSGMSVNGKVVAAETEGDSAVAWLEQASPAELSDMRALAITDKLSLALLQRIAAAKPNIGLLIESREDLTKYLSLFRPQLLSLGEHVDSISGLVASQRNIETLWMSATDSGSLAEIRKLPKLRELVLSKWEPPYAGVLPARLEALWLPDGEVNTHALDGLGNLRTLVLSGSWWNGGPFDHSQFKRLQWFGFPKNTTQTGFQTMIQAHPNLEVIELLAQENAIDLAPLGELRHLRAVTLDGAFTNLALLQRIPTLEFVGFSDDMWSDVAGEAAAIQAALPAAVVVKVLTLCLGSGWILLIIPIVLLVMLAAPRRRVA